MTSQPVVFNCHNVENQVNEMRDPSTIGKKQVQKNEIFPEFIDTMIKLGSKKKDTFKCTSHLNFSEAG